jgi:hypothetical protein
VSRRLADTAGAAVYRRFRWSTSARAASTVALVIGGYVLLHARFAAFDAAIAQHALRAVGFHVHSSGSSGLVVSSGAHFAVTAIVTGSCSSAAGVLGLVGVTFVLLPGTNARRVVGGAAAALLFVACNQLRICSILMLGWWLATASHTTLLVSLLTPAVVALPFVLLPHRHLLLRIACFLVGGLSGVLAFDVWRHGDYLHGMISYHALAGPMLTFATLAGGIILLWRVIVGNEPDLRPSPAG